MADSSLLHFERRNFNNDIEIWLDAGDGSPASTKVVVPVTTFQKVLRICNALDSLTIEMFSTAIEISSPAVRLENVNCVLKHLRLERLPADLGRVG
jgi:hypothetical protein